MKTDSFIQNKIAGIWKEVNPQSENSIYDFAYSEYTALEKQTIVNYLNGGSILTASPGIIKSIFDNSIVAGTASTKTDGEWIWPNTLSYYVDKHNVELPGDLLKKIVNQNGLPSEVSDLKLIEISKRLQDVFMKR